MRAPFTRLHVHLVWSTWDRDPLLTPEVEAVVYRVILSECTVLGTEALAVGGVDDHIHVLARIPTTLAIAELVRKIKGASSRIATRETGRPLRWQGGYGAFAVSSWDVERITRYIRGQKRHHANRSLSQTLEKIYE